MPNPWDVQKPQKSTNPWDRDRSDPFSGFADTSQPLPGSNADTSLAIKPMANIDRKNDMTRNDIPALLGGLAAAPFTEGMSLVPAASTMFAASGLSDLAKQAYEKGQEKLGFPKIFTEPGPKTVRESLSRAGIQGGLAAASEVGGRTLGKAFMPFSGGVTPEIQSQVRAAESEGIRPPLSTMTNSKSVQALERIGEVSPFGNVITKQKASALNALEAYTGRIADQMAPNRPPEVTGNLAKESLNTFKQVYDQTKKNLYETAYKSMPEEAKSFTPDLTNTMNALSEIINRRQGTAEPGGLNSVRDWLNDVIGKKIPSNIVDKEGKPYLQQLTGKIKTFDDLSRMMTNVGQKANSAFGDPAAVGLNADLKQLYGAMGSDSDKFIAKYAPQFGEQLAKADEYYSIGKGTLKSKVYQSILNNPNPSTVYKSVIAPNSPEMAQLGKEILGDNFKDVQRQWFQDVVNNSMIGNEGEKVISPAKLATNLRKYGSTIPAMFQDNPAIAEQFKKLEDISLLLGRGGKITQGSQTAFIVNNVANLMAPITAFLAGNTKAGLGLAAGVGLEGAMTGAMTTNLGRRWLTTGLPTAGKIATRTAQPAIQLGLQQFLDNQNQ